METLHPRIRVAWVAKVLLVAALAGLLLALAGGWIGAEWLWLLALALGLAGAALAVLRYRSWSFEVQDDALYLERGVITAVATSVPFVRIQHVDTRRGPVERLLGLASVVVYTAGSRGADVAIPGLTRARADALRERLQELAVRSEFEDAT